MGRAAHTQKYTSMSAIVIEHLVKQFPQASDPAVRDCNVRVEQGEFIVLLGPSGCGKTTLLMINRLIEPTSGRIFVDGTEIHDLPATQLRRRIGYVIQQTGLFPHMRIAENIAVVPRLLGWDEAKISARIDELLSLVGLPLDYRERYPRQLSGGEQQRVGIARALAADPKIVLMDEPFSAIDAITRSRLQDELRAIQQKVHKTILFVTHDVEEALKLADRIVVMQSGSVVQYDTPLTVLSQPANDFVRQLVGGDNQLRRLSVLPAEMAMQAGVPLHKHWPTIAHDADLRTALSLLLANEVPALIVERHGKPVGTLSFEGVRGLTLEMTETQGEEIEKELKVEG
jgi:osmoprotectant transport system ATP-binding protein